MNIDNGTSWAILDRCLPPKIGKCSTTLLKTTLWAIRSLNAFGMDIEVDRKRIKKRTGYTIRSIDEAIRTLQDEKALLKTNPHSPAGSARFRVNYLRLMDWLDDEDRADIDALMGRRKHRNSEMISDSKSETSSDLKSEMVSGQVGNDFHQNRKPLLPKSEMVSDSLKEVSASSALSAPSAPPNPTGESIDRVLVNLTIGGGAGGVMDRSGWEALGKQAKLSTDLRTRCATTLETRGVLDAETGLAAMEKLADRMRSKGIESPIGLFTSFVAGKDITGPCNTTIARHSERDDKRRRLAANIEHNWSDELKRTVYYRVRGLLNERCGESRSNEIMVAWRTRSTLLDWDAMLDFIAANWDRIGKASKPTNESKEEAA